MFRTKPKTRSTYLLLVILFFCYHYVSKWFLPFLSLSTCNPLNKMPPKGKEIVEIPNPLIDPQVDFHHTPLVNKDCKIIESSSQFDLYEIYCCMEDQLVDQSDEIGLWDSNLPHYIFPHKHRAPKFVRKCHESYDPNQRAIIPPTGEILCFINVESIEKILQAPTMAPTHPFSRENLIGAYQKLDLTKISQTLEFFLAVHSPLPERNPPMVHPCSQK